MEPVDKGGGWQSSAAAKAELDRLDDELLSLFEKRLGIAAQVARAKSAAGLQARLHPDRERAVLDRVLSRTSPDNRDAVAGLWREIVGWSLERQGPLSIQVWSPGEPGVFDAARRRFGAAAAMRAVRDPGEALSWAAEGEGIVVLALDAKSPWWIDLPQEGSSLRVFDGFGDDLPTALAVGRIDAGALAMDRRVFVERDLEVRPARGRRRLGSADGWILSISDPFTPMGPARGCVGGLAYARPG